MNKEFVVIDNVIIAKEEVVSILPHWDFDAHCGLITINTKDSNKIKIGFKPGDKKDFINAVRSVREQFTNKENDNV